MDGIRGCIIPLSYKLSPLRKAPDHLDHASYPFGPDTGISAMIYVLAALLPPLGLLLNG
jgi:hypothetical protein